MAQPSGFSDYIKFMAAWAKDPKGIGAIAPSGEKLAQLITCEIDPNAGKVLELGPGTGVFTKAILARGVKAEDLIAFEADVNMAQLLAPRYPNVRILNEDASNLARKDYLNGEKCSCAISGLPFLIISPRKTMQILIGTFKHLKPHGALYEFTYSPKCSIPRYILDRLGLKSERVYSTFQNIPPASIFKITKRAPVPLAS